MSFFACGSGLTVASNLKMTEFRVSELGRERERVGALP